jgi:hypothetical protein
MDLKLIKRRRKAIQQDAPCVGCGSTLASCKANRGKDPTAPPWFGCCARGLSMTPCDHRPDPGALTALLEEVESGNVRDEADVLLDSLQEYPRPRIGSRVGPRDGLLDGIYPADYYARGEDDY